MLTAIIIPVVKNKIRMPHFSTWQIHSLYSTIFFWIPSQVLIFPLLQMQNHYIDRIKHFTYKLESKLYFFAGVFKYKYNQVSTRKLGSFANVAEMWRVKRTWYVN